MITLLPDLKIIFPASACLYLLVNVPSSSCQESPKISHAIIALSIQRGISEDGAATSAWRKQRGVEFNSPFEFALWECLTEGLENYRSLSNKWLHANGALTPHAQAALQRLQPIFVERLAALEHATEEEAVQLLEGLSRGTFDQKWGALTTALWLAQEARGDERNLRKWVEAGPLGVLQLARKYLPAQLKVKTPKREQE